MHSLLFLILSTKIKNAFNILNGFNPSIFTRMLNLSKKNPKIFNKFSNSIIEDDYLRVLFLEHFAVSIESLTDFVKTCSPEIIRFIESLLKSDIKPKSPACDLNWLLIFVSSMLNSMQNSEIFYHLLISIFKFCNKVLSINDDDKYDNQISQLNSIVFSALSIANDKAEKVTMLKCLKQLMFHKSSSMFLKQYIFIFKTLLNNMKKETEIEVNIAAFKVFRNIVVYHPKIFASLANQNELFSEIAMTIPSRNWRKIIQVYKLILNYCKYNKDTGNLQSLFSITNYKIGSSIKLIRNKVDNRHMHILLEMEQFLNQPKNPMANFFSKNENEKKRFGSFKAFTHRPKHQSLQPSSLLFK